MSDTWFSLTVDLPEDSKEALETALYDAGASGLEIRDREAPPMPGVRGPAAGEAIVVGWFATQEEAEGAAGMVAGEFTGARTQVDRLEPQDWSTSWRSLIKCVQVGRLWVGPPWDTDKAPADKVKLTIEPKMAFGTGDHPTTSLCLEAVDTYMGAHPGASVLDVGTGTAVLAIAAKKLGATRVVGLDNDVTSVELARENLEVNATPDIELSTKTLRHVQGTFDLVLANILANTLVELAPLIAPKVKDRLVLAGVLVHQRDEVMAAYEKQGLKPAGEKVHNEWIRLELQR
ncbi:MAG: 50S ribosomal protein L11 methyltransferase [Deltaproteobacteria bacterium]|nr:50S ribosomal protein L11 methyltransferase [Deltaproteobacteria bacterium]